MISQLTSAPAVTLTPEDMAICSGAWAQPFSGVSCAATDAKAVRAGIIYMMRKGDRKDYANILAGVDDVWLNPRSRHYVRAFLHS